MRRCCSNNIVCRCTKAFLLSFASCFTLSFCIFLFMSDGSLEMCMKSVSEFRMCIYRDCHNPKLSISERKKRLEGITLDLIEGHKAPARGFPCMLRDSQRDTTVNNLATRFEQLRGVHEDE